MEEFEYGVQFKNHPAAEPHRTGMTSEQAREWIRTTEKMGGVPEGSFVIVRRRIGAWERP
jgi:hypothetical protein